MLNPIKWLLPLLFLLTGCEKETIPQAHQKMYPVRADVTIQRDVPHYIRAIGELTASVAVDVRAQVSGILTNVLFIDGDKVEEGDLLMTIDPRPFQAELKKAQANLKEDQARLRYALEFAESYGKLVGNEYVSRLDYEEGIQNVDVYKSAIEEDLAAVETASISLGYTEIRAPTRGYIGLRKFDPGNYVAANANQVLVTIRKVTPLCLSFSVPSEYVHKIREAQKKTPIYLEAFTTSDPHHPLKGYLVFIDNTVDDRTGMIHLQGNIPNEDERGWPGQFVRTKLLLETIQNAILVPTSAIVLGQNGYFVFVINEDLTVQMRSIEKGIEEGDYTVVVSGLNVGEKVVTDGQLNLSPGANVTISNLHEISIPKNRENFDEEDESEEFANLIKKMEKRIL